MALSDNSLLELYDVSIESKMTSTDWDGLLDQLRNNRIQALLNLYYYTELNNSLADGVDLSREKLTDFINRRIKEANIREEALQQEDLKAIRDEYGELFYKYNSVPVIVIRDKMTGELVEIPYPVHPFVKSEELRAFIDALR